MRVFGQTEADYTTYGNVLHSFFVTLVILSDIHIKATYLEVSSTKKKTSMSLTMPAFLLLTLFQDTRYSSYGIYHELSQPTTPRFPLLIAPLSLLQCFTSPFALGAKSHYCLNTAAAISFLQAQKGSGKGYQKANTQLVIASAHRGWKKMSGCVQLFEEPGASRKLSETVEYRKLRVMVCNHRDGV